MKAATGVGAIDGLLFRRGLLAVLATIVISALAASARADAAVQPYGTNDAGGFRNVLPAGENGLDNAAQLAEFHLHGTYPPHFKDQLPLYAGLIYASPTLTREQIPGYYKDATFGVKEGDLASTESPRSDVTIQRDSSFGVPHVYGTTRGGVMFGAGYAAAADRLFLIDVLRHAARAELSSFAGGAEGNRAMDRTQYLIAPYTEADLQSQLDNAPALYGAEGEKIVSDLNEFVAGINAYIAEALVDPNKMPAEYAGIGKTPAMWKPTDVIAEASLIGGIFGKGGGSEVRSALALEAFEKQFGTKGGRARWSDFREHNDPEAPTTVSKAFPYETGSPFAKTGLAMPEPGSVSFVNDGEPLEGASAAAAPKPNTGEMTHTPSPQPIPSDGSLGSQLLRAALSGPPHASNWELVNAKHSSNGHAIAVMGPQVGYYNPEILMEEDLHGPGIDARGAAFPGVNLYVELGHGRDYAWSATTATSDNVDTFAEVLCQDEFHYRYKGQCLAMEKLEHTNAWTPNGSDQTPPGAEKLTAYRTVHGIVYARGSVAGQKVAFASARTTYFHEADSALGFSKLNEPGFVTGPQQFEQAAANINFAFNWAYVDASHIAYYQSGAYPQRALGTSPDFPILGTGEYDWQGYEPKLHTLTLLPFEAHPNAIDPAFLVSWNNKQAPRWSSADDHYAYGPVYRMQLIRNFIEADLAGGKKMGIEQLVTAMDEAATQDVRMVQLWPTVKQALGTPSNPLVQEAIAKLDAWSSDGGHRRDLTNKDISTPGSYQHNEAVTLMDAWWPKLLEAEFRGGLGDEVFGAVQTMLPFGGPYPGSEPAAPDFADGWYGQVSKDLRDLLAANGQGTAPKAPYSQIYCGGGSLAACQQALQTSLLEATSVSPQQVYGHGACEANPQASCFDMNRWVSASGISVPPFPFQNRPTFQQVVELTKTLPR
ncbi:MAG TPA: penicillin acylase family protein [Solirubrobacteraceae bacterium]|jgi:acyl-homoserine lactone acylase PvdQ|nr:penicillin acylase family protein [Solirubrobacteraceae bacterium]